MDPSVPLETICRLIIRARQLEGRISMNDLDGGDGADDPDEIMPDDITAGSEDGTDTTAEDELRALLGSLSIDEISDVLALAWIGRGTYDASEWDDAREEAADAQDRVDQLLDLPMLAAYLDAGLSAFDLSCEGMDRAG